MQHRVISQKYIFQIRQNQDKSLRFWQREVFQTRLNNYWALKQVAKRMFLLPQSHSRSKNRKVAKFSVTLISIFHFAPRILHINLPRQNYFIIFFSPDLLNFTKYMYTYRREYINVTCIFHFILPAPLFSSVFLVFYLAYIKTTWSKKNSHPYIFHSYTHPRTRPYIFILQTLVQQERCFTVMHLFAFLLKKKIVGVYIYIYIYIQMHIQENS